MIPGTIFSAAGPASSTPERDHLHRRLPLGELRHVDLHVELGQELAQAGDEDLAHEDDDRRPDRPAVDRIVVHQHHQHGADQQLVGDRVEHAAERRLLLPDAGEVAVEPVGQAGKHEQRERRPARRIALQEKQAGDERRHGRNANVGEDVRQAHRQGAGGGSVFHGVFGTPSGRWVVNGARGPRRIRGRRRDFSGTRRGWTGAPSCRGGSGPDALRWPPARAPSQIACRSRCAGA